MRISTLATIALTAGLTMPALALASADLPSHNAIKQAAGATDTSKQRINIKYVEAAGGYNAKDGKGVGYIGTGLHIGDHFEHTLGVHHRQESDNASYGVDAMTYAPLPVAANILVNGGILMGRTYHDELDRESGNYVGAKAGVMYSPTGNGYFYLNYTHQFGTDDNPDIGFSQIGYRFLFN